MNKHLILLYSGFLMILTACSGLPATKPDPQKLALSYAKDMLIVDTHIDVPYRLEEKPADVTGATEDGDFDYPRAVAGGLNVPFMSIYVPAEKEKDGTAKAHADLLINQMEALTASAPQKFALAYNTDDVRKNFASGIISLPLGMENGAPMEGDLANLKHFYDRGIRYITLTHSKSNHISDSSYDEERLWGGLSAFGKKLVVAMNKTGVMVDVSHVSDDAFYDVMKITRVPVIASHSSARRFTPEFERNMNDDMIRLLAKQGGVIMINFGSTFLNQDSRDNYNAMKAARDAYLEAYNLVDDEHARDAFTDNYRESTPFHYATVSDVLDHIDHVRELAGIDYVGLGSDFDGVGDTLPTGLKDVADYPNLIAGLIERGYSKADIEKILSGNIMRVWREVEKYAVQH